MRVRIGDKPRGIVLAVTMMTVIVVGLILTSYIALAVQINAWAARSQSWNEAIPVLESGIEEAMTQLYYAGTNSSLLTSNSWTLAGTGCITRSARSAMAVTSTRAFSPRATRL